MPDEDGPRLIVALGHARVANDLRAIDRAARSALPQGLQRSTQRRPHAGLDGGQGLAAGCHGFPGPVPPRGELRRPAAGDVVVGDALPLALSQLQDPGVRAEDGDGADGRVGEGDGDGRGGRGADCRRPAGRHARWRRPPPAPWRRPGRAGNGRSPAAVRREAAGTGTREGRASRSPARAAWRRPSSDSGVSACPWNRPSRIHSDSPCRTSTRVASRPSGIGDPSAGRRSRAVGASLTARPPGGSSRRRPPRGWRGSPPRRRAAPRRPAPGP